MGMFRSNNKLTGTRLEVVMDLALLPDSHIQQWLSFQEDLARGLVDFIVYHRPNQATGIKISVVPGNAEDSLRYNASYLHGKIELSYLLFDRKSIVSCTLAGAQSMKDPNAENRYVVTV